MCRDNFEGYGVKPKDELSRSMHGNSLGVFEWKKRMDN